jgi:hypothetical protein
MVPCFLWEKRSAKAMTRRYHVNAKALPRRDHRGPKIRPMGVTLSAITPSFAYLRSPEVLANLLFCMYYLDNSRSEPRLFELTSSIRETFGYLSLSIYVTSRFCGVNRRGMVERIRELPAGFSR